VEDRMKLRVGDMLVDENGRVVGTVLRLRSDGKLRLRVPPREDEDMDLGATEAITKKSWEELRSKYHRVSYSDWRERLKYIKKKKEQTP
jgi:hypothetical protein